MPASQSPTSRPSSRSSAGDLKARTSISSHTVIENAEAPERTSGPKLSFTGVSAAGASEDRRRASIQFALGTETPVRESRQRIPSMKLQRRMSSPPPPSLLVRSFPVSEFDFSAQNSRSVLHYSLYIFASGIRLQSIHASLLQTATKRFSGMALEIASKLAASPKKISEVRSNLGGKISNAAKDINADIYVIFHNNIIDESRLDARHRRMPHREPRRQEYDLIRYAYQDLADEENGMPDVFSHAETSLSHISDGEITNPNKVSNGSTYKTRVNFVTSDYKIPTDIAFTLNAKHKNHKYTPRSRTFLCGTDENDYSEFALEWLLEELAEDDDEIVCLRVVTPDSKLSNDAFADQKIYQEEARKLLEHIKRKNEDGKAINFIVELAVGKVEETFQRMIRVYAPASLIVGTKGRSRGGIQGLRAGSISKYCLQNSPVPVVVVRPQDKRQKKRGRRLADPTRQGYNDIVKQSNANGSRDGTFDVVAHAQQWGGEASNIEASAVAKAIGLKEGAFEDGKGFTCKREENTNEGMEIGAPLTMVATAATAKSDAVSEPESPSPTGPMLIMDDNTEDVPQTDLGESVVSGAGGEDDGADKGKEKEERVDQRMDNLKTLQDLSLADAEEAEAGKGKGKEREL